MCFYREQAHAIKANDEPEQKVDRCLYFLFYNLSVSLKLFHK